MQSPRSPLLPHLSVCCDNTSPPAEMHYGGGANGGADRTTLAETHRKVFVPPPPRQQFTGRASNNIAQSDWESIRSIPDEKFSSTGAVSASSHPFQ